MTHEQIIGNVVIALVVGVFLIVVGAVMQPLLKSLWERMNRPSPLTPQTKGQLVANRAIWEAELERLNYLSTHSKDLFLRLLQLMMVVLLFSVAAFLTNVLWTQAHDALYANFLVIVMVVLLTFACVMAGLGLWEANRLSDKNIDATKGSIQKRLDEIDRRLNPPA